MPIRTAEAQWQGDLRHGNGWLRYHEGTPTLPYSFASRFEEGEGTNPEELIGAAHAGCFSMALAGLLAAGGHAPKHVHTTAQVHIDKADDGFRISAVELVTEVRAANIGPGEFSVLAEEAKRGCPVSKALAGTDIRLRATLL